MRSARNQCCARKVRGTVAAYWPVAVAVLIFSGSVADAASIANRDDVDRTVTVIEGNVSSDHVLKPQQVLDNICPKGCVVRLNGVGDPDENEYDLEAGDVVSIEDGYMYYDAPSPSGTTAPAAGPTAPPPSGKP